jgi:hypothetical protein
MTRLHTNTLAIDSMVWLWGLSVGLLLGVILGLLLGVILGVVCARRQHRQRDQRGHGGSVTDWGLSLARVTELRRGDQPAAPSECAAAARPNEVARGIGPRRLFAASSGPVSATGTRAVRREPHATMAGRP